MKVTVTAVDQEFTFETGQDKKGREILQMICSTESLAQRQFFGLNYKNSENEQVWIETSKKNVRQLKNFTDKINFGVKYCPEDVDDELVDSVTIEYFFKEMKNNIITGAIYCPSDTSVILAALALQATYEDYTEVLQKKINPKKLLPAKVLSGQKMDETAWSQNIAEFWAKYSGMDKEEAMLDYLKIVQGLDMYGVTYFGITNKKGSGVLLGITAYGLNIYDENNKLTPKIAFPWSEIKHLKFRDERFTIQLMDKVVKDFCFTTSSSKSSKNILNLGVGNHTLYVKRRKEDSPELAKMKEKFQLNRERRRLEKQKLLVEKSARVELERREKELIEQMKKMQSDMDAKNRELLEAQKNIEKLSIKLKELQQSKEELELKSQELRDMMRTLEESKNLEALEREKLEAEVREKQQQVEKIFREVQERDEETRRLQAEVEEARRKEEEEALRRAEEERVRREQEEEEERRRMEREELEQIENANNSLPEISVNEDVKAQLKVLQQQLDETKNSEQESEEDRIHRENLKMGRDKFKTLRDIRSGNTKRRAELFENM